jgi:hypothetical protein
MMVYVVGRWVANNRAKQALVFAIGVRGGVRDTKKWATKRNVLANSLDWRTGRGRVRCKPDSGTWEIC